MVYAQLMCTKDHKIPISGPYRPYQKHKGKYRKKKFRKTQIFFFSKQQPETYHISKNEQKTTDTTIFSSAEALHHDFSMVNVHKIP